MCAEQTFTVSNNKCINIYQKYFALLSKCVASNCLFLKYRIGIVKQKKLTFLSNHQPFTCDFA